MPVEGSVGSGGKGSNFSDPSGNSDALRQNGNDAFKRRAHYKLGHYAASAADAEASLALEGSSQKARYRAALAHLMLGQPQAAQPLVTELLEQEAATVDNATLPPYLRILLAAAEAMSSHAACMARLAEHRQGAGLAPGASNAWQGAARVQQLLQTLSDDMDGVADADISFILGELLALLLASGEARAAFEAEGGYPLVLCYLTEAYCTQAAPVLQAASGWQQLMQPQARLPPQGQQQRQEQAAGGNAKMDTGAGAVMWPPLVWQRLASTALSPSGGAPAVAAMQLLAWAAGDLWACTQVLVHPLPVRGSWQGTGSACSTSRRSSPLEDVVKALQGLPEGGLSPAVVEIAIELLARYGEDRLCTEALSSMRLQPLQTLLNVFAVAKPLLEAPQRPSLGTGGSAGAGYGEDATGSQAPASEEEALQQLRERQRGVFDARVVRIQRCALQALCALSCRPELAAAETPAGNRSKKAASQPQGFVAGLMKLARVLHEQSPKRTWAVLGPDGRPKSYCKKPFAADFKDNPAGDFLASLDLEDAAPGKTLSLDHPTATGTAAAHSPSQTTLLELTLIALLQLGSGDSVASGAATASAGRGGGSGSSSGGSGTAMAGQLYRLDVLGLCEALWAYSTPGVVELAQRLCAAVAERHPPAFSELLQDGSVMGLASILQYTHLPEQYTSSTSLHGTSEAGASPGATAGGSNSSSAGSGGSSGAGLAGQPGPDATAAASQALHLVYRAVDKLGMLVDSSSGDEFFYFTQQPGGALLRGFQLARAVATATQGGGGDSGAAEGLASAATKLRAAAERFVLLCCNRAQRQQGLLRWQCPRGGAWTRCSGAALQALLPAKGGIGAAASSGGKAGAGGGSSKEKGTEEGKEVAPDDSGSGLAKLRRGFLGADSNAKRAQHGGQSAGQWTSAPAQASSSETASQASQFAAAAVQEHQSRHNVREGGFGALTDQQPRVVIEDITEQEGGVAPSQQAQQEREAGWRAQHEAWLAQQAWAQQQEKQEGGGDDSDVEDLRSVYDSTPSQEVRQIRNAWRNVPLAERVRWDQTSTDVNAWVVMPQGTRARDVRVSIQPGRLTVSLGWYGRVVDGELHRRCKASETQWCMEDNEVHVILPKDDRSYWKALFVDGEERGYFDLLKEAVSADEPATPYDEMDERSKELLEEMLERQAMINEGLIDPEGFDDFRVVLGESSLVQS